MFKNGSECKCSYEVGVGLDQDLQRLYKEKGRGISKKQYALDASNTLQRSPLKMRVDWEVQAKCKYHSISSAHLRV